MASLLEECLPYVVGDFSSYCFPSEQQSTSLYPPHSDSRISAPTETGPVVMIGYIDGFLIHISSV